MQSLCRVYRSDRSLTFARAPEAPVECWRRSIAGANVHERYDRVAIRLIQRIYVPLPSAESSFRSAAHKVMLREH